MSFQRDASSQTLGIVLSLPKTVTYDYSVKSLRKQSVNNHRVDLSHRRPHQQRKRHVNSVLPALDQRRRTAGDGVFFGLNTISPGLPD